MPIPLMAAMGAVKGLAGIAGGIIGSGKRKREQRAAQKEYNAAKEELFSQDMSNPYQNMENVYEDLTVNTQQADYASQQQQQALQNTMAGLQGAAGGSGIAALAQSLAGQQSQNLQGASASIANQESQNQMMERQGADQIQNQKVEGDLWSRGQKKDRAETMMGMAQNRLGAAKDARSAATKSIIGGVTGLVGAGAQIGADGGFGLGVKKFLGGNKDE